MNPKTYKTEKGAHAAVKRQALHLMSYDVEPIIGGGFAPYFYVQTRADYDELWGRGFQAEINPDKAA